VRRNPLTSWASYLRYLDEGPHSVRLTTSDLVPHAPCLHPERVVIATLGYTLWPFQQKILDEIGDSILILGLPTGLGKTYLAGATLHRESATRPLRVLFLVPTVPLGVQQTLFAREKLGVTALFVSGGISPARRARLQVWNNAFVVTTPQTFYNDHLAQYRTQFTGARRSDDPIAYLADVIDSFPFDVVVADECQRYIGKTDGYAILLAARSQGTRILALSATPHLHAPHRLHELRHVFDRIKTFGVDDPGIREHLPPRLLVVEEVPTPPTLLTTYRALGDLIRIYTFRARKMYGTRHPRNCSAHPLCRALLSVRMLRQRLVEDGASSVETYGTWKFRDLQNKRKSLAGESVRAVFERALDEQRNHKFGFAQHILAREVYAKSIVYIESVEGAKQFASQLCDRYGMDGVACLVGKGDMTMDQQASALLHFRQAARILVCTSIGEEGLDIPSADVEVWIDPPNNPRKWIQRFGRVLRQPGGKKLARIYALVSRGTHEKRKLFNVKQTVEATYGFTQSLEIEVLKPLVERQRTMVEYLDR
jgi:ERCC4-related helicase